MTCISCTASIDYVLVSALEHILAVSLIYLILFFFVFFCCLFFTLPYVHSYINCVFVDFLNLLQKIIIKSFYTL